MARWILAGVDLKLEECGGGGNCLFSSVARGLTLLCGQPVSSQDLRDELAKSLCPANVNEFIRRVRDDHKLYVPGHAVNFNHLKFHRTPEIRVRQVQRIVMTAGQTFQGTDVCLQQLMEHSAFFRGGLGTAVLTAHGPGFSVVQPDFHATERARYLLLYCDGNSHWRLAHLPAEAGGAARCYLTRDQLSVWLARL